MTMTALWQDPTPLVLASGSKARRDLLAAAGIPLVIVRPIVDEAALAADLLRQGQGPLVIAAALAAAKAEAAVKLEPGRVLLAADQTLAFEGKLAMKAGSIAEARENLLMMRGKTHELHSSAVLRRDGDILWTGTATATLRMRMFSDAFLETYLAIMGMKVCDTVGGYELEALGIQLFDRIDGDHATILGLPLRAVLEALRNHGSLAR
jgi:septum formation protein